MEGFGGYDQAERQMIAFHPDALVFSWDYPICCIKVEPKALKSVSYTHLDVYKRQYLYLPDFGNSKKAKSRYGLLFYYRGRLPLRFYHMEKTVKDLPGTVSYTHLLGEEVE